ncbi:hypothetical protein CNE_BB1p06540 (plasmid) [Cupriavidus necator N-1]|uniref:Uncharacterized protein n=1 Tax=Cupriavidus necator (strain ATCC 43291 / DSM 13513 / CCUG 52238 / LMG 8453 / N-1) TaxID=1042878 RepID=F8GXK4_CUPNN|nr:hypothetical protein CNE_BB1p06540 [Cupriavidus necator N-1]
MPSWLKRTVNAGQNVEFFSFDWRAIETRMTCERG